MHNLTEFFPTFPTPRHSERIAAKLRKRRIQLMSARLRALYIFKASTLRPKLAENIKHTPTFDPTSSHQQLVPGDESQQKRNKKTPNNLLKRLLLSFIWIYRRLVSPFMPPRCRYLPTCSQYAADAIELNGAWKGLILAIKRVGKCHPWGGSGFDPARKI